MPRLVSKHDEVSALWGFGKSTTHLKPLVHDDLPRNRSSRDDYPRSVQHEPEHTSDIFDGSLHWHAAALRSTGDGSMRLNEKLLKATAMKSVLQERKRLKCPAEGRLQWEPEPLIEDRRVDPAEVHKRLQVAVHEIGHAGIGTEQARLDGRTGQKHRAGGAVVGAGRAVLFDSAAELAETQHQDAVRQLGVRQVVEECFRAPESSPSSPKWVPNCCECVS